jgi:hypothetical protein
VAPSRSAEATNDSQRSRVRLTATGLKSLAGSSASPIVRLPNTPARAETISSCRSWQGVAEHPQPGDPLGDREIRPRTVVEGGPGGRDRLVESAGPTSGSSASTFSLLGLTTAKRAPVAGGCQLPPMNSSSACGTTRSTPSRTTVMGTR